MRKKMNRTIPLIASLAILALAACGKEPEAPEIEPTIGEEAEAPVHIP
ncbi:MAG: hypothetical protein GX614_06910, partial [Sandaracinaceae bacterium]|nr:hypothetical protein [Sandaracinaceae bacterium]